jgi:hypothetical protein
MVIITCTPKMKVYGILLCFIYRISDHIRERSNRDLNQNFHSNMCNLWLIGLGIGEVDIGAGRIKARGAGVDKYPSPFGKRWI